MIQRIKALTADHLGLISAFICMIHCMITPLLFGAYAHAHSRARAFGPDFAAMMGQPKTHPADYWHMLDYVFLAIGLAAVYYAARHAYNRWIKGLLWGSFVLLASCIFMESQAALFANLLYVASGILMLAHGINIVQQRRCSSEVCERC
ncbi:MAG: MerC domain-containing protein [Bacteroidia bacterium]